MVNIYVGNLAYTTTEDDLRKMFETHGTVDRANLAMDRMSGRGRGFGFVEMPNESEARKAIKELNETELGGRNLIVNEAKPKADHGSSRRDRY